MPHRVLILTRDGVLISDRYTAGTEEVILPGALEAVSRLKHAGYHIVVQATCGLDDNFTLARQNALHVELQHRVSEAGGSFDAFFYCPHRSASKCRCAPPNNGLLEDIAERWRVSLQDVVVVCPDEAGLATAAKTGAITVPVNAAYQSGESALSAGVKGYPSLAAFAEAHLSGNNT
jgi:D-glycero-D-manno-heptose 1,7-bisphosphate phosphatase